MKHTLKFFGVAALCLSGAALAQPIGPQGHGPNGPDKAEMAKFALEHCQDRKAHAVGELAYLETKLALSDKQKPLFERWKKIKLGEANSAECAPPPGERPSIVEHLKQEEKFLQTRLAALKAELPALDALYATLSDEQKKAFAPPPPDGPRGHGPQGGPGFGPGPHNGPLGHGPDGPGDHPPQGGPEH